METLNVVSCLSPNFGDALGPWMVEKLSGKKVLFADRDAAYPHHVTIGSILNWANEHSTVWGAGLACAPSRTSPSP